VTDLIENVVMVNLTWSRFFQAFQELQVRTWEAYLLSISAIIRLRVNWARGDVGELISCFLRLKLVLRVKIRHINSLIRNVRLI
jgi:hypothetical protein